jgi:hypothetical protein
MSIDENLCQIDRYREMRSQELRALRTTRERLTIEQTGNPSLPFMLATVSYGEHVSQALIDWCDETLSLLKQLSATEKHRNKGAVTENIPGPGPHKAPNPGTRR